MAVNESDGTLLGLGPLLGAPYLAFNESDGTLLGSNESDGTLLGAGASGTGSSCTNAISSLDTQLRDLARTFCGTMACQFTIVYTQTCTLIAPGTYQVVGYGRHGCRDSTC